MSTSPATHPESELERLLAFQIYAAKLPSPQREYHFALPRKFRFDLCWPPQWLAVEIEGGVFTRGRHSRGAGIRDDCEKSALAAIRGWRLMRVMSDHVKSGQALAWIEQALGGK